MRPPRRQVRPGRGGKISCRRGTKLPERSGTLAEDPFSGRDPTSHERLAGLPWDASYHDGPAPWEIGRASCRERGEISGVAAPLKKKKKKADALCEHTFRTYNGGADTDSRVTAH